MYGGQDANFMYDESTFQDRYDDVMAVLTACLRISSKRIDANILAGVQGYRPSDESSHDS
jgi:UDP-N-acetylenolpyruvoylglucosamine reductase